MFLVFTFKFVDHLPLRFGADILKLMNREEIHRFLSKTPLLKANILLVYVLKVESGGIRTI